MQVTLIAQIISFFSSGFIIMEFILSQLSHHFYRIISGMFLRFENDRFTANANTGWANFEQRYLKHINHNADISFVEDYGHQITASMLILLFCILFLLVIIANAFLQWEIHLKMFCAHFKNRELLPSFYRISQHMLASRKRAQDYISERNLSFDPFMILK